MFDQFYEMTWAGYMVQFVVTMDSGNYIQMATQALRNTRGREELGIRTKDRSAIS